MPKRNKTPAGASSSSSSSFDDKSQREGSWGAKGGCFFGKVPSSRVSLLGSRWVRGRRLRMSRIILISVSQNFFFFFVPAQNEREFKRDLLFRVLPRLQGKKFLRKNFRPFSGLGQEELQGINNDHVEKKNTLLTLVHTYNTQNNHVLLDPNCCRPIRPRDRAEERRLQTVRRRFLRALFFRPSSSFFRTTTTLRRRVYSRGGVLWNPTLGKTPAIVRVSYLG